MKKIKNKEEEIFVDKCVNIFHDSFIVQREVKSQCKTGRIDILLTYEDNYHFGIECKPFNRKTGEMIGNYIKQAIRYQFLKWEVKENQFMRIPILICPAISSNYFIMNNEYQIINDKIWHKDRHKLTDIHHSFNGFLGEFGIGEVRKAEPKGYRFSISNKTLFSKIEYKNGQKYYDLNHIEYLKYIHKYPDIDTLFT